MRRTKEESEQTREDILNAAVCIFAEKGVACTTLDEIAKAANVTRGAIYWHFDNKVQIFEALHERLHQPFVGMVLEDLEKNHPEPLVQLRDLWLNILLDLEHNEKKRLALTLFVIKRDYSGELSKYKEEHRAKKAECMNLFERYFEKAQKVGKLSSDNDPKVLSEAMSCYMKGILLEYLDNVESFDLKKKAPELIDLFFKICK